MTEDHRSRLQRLQDLNVSLRRQWEVAEALLPQFDLAIEQLAMLETSARFALSGPILWDRPYNSDQGADDRGQVAQAVLKFPGGLGVWFRDAEDYVAGEPCSGHLDSVAIDRFVPFKRCDKALQSRLAAAVLPLVDQLIDTLTAKGPVLKCPS